MHTFQIIRAYLFIEFPRNLAPVIEINTIQLLNNAMHVISLYIKNRTIAYFHRSIVICIVLLSFK